MMKKIIVFGAGGQLGQEFRFISKDYPQYSFIFWSKEDLDITSYDEIQSKTKLTNPDYIINCAAYTAVDKAESDIEQCYKVNKDAPASIAKVCAENNIRLVHFSTDYVYHTYDGFPLHEDSITEPMSIYAQSKYAGEQVIRAEKVNALIVRTSWVISSYGHNFVKTMMRLGKTKEKISVVNDQYGAPTYARDLAKTILDIINKVESDQNTSPYFNATYNFANEGFITWYDLAKEIMAISNMPCGVDPIPSAQYPTPAVRPKWSVLSKQKIKSTFDLDIPHWYDAVQRCIGEIEIKERQG